ncbi:Ankyrin repeat-containing domain containing protein [Oxalobacteraceae bacterium]
MRPIPKDTMKMRCPNIEETNGINSDEKKIPERKSSHVIFLFDGLDQKRKTKIEKLINYFSEDKIKISKLGCAPFGNGSADEKKLIFLEALGNKVKSEEIGKDTSIFMNFHTRYDADKLSFSIKGIDEVIRIPVKEVYQYVWSFFPGREKPSFHNLGCNSGYYAPDLQHGDGHVINYAGKSTISQNENIIQAKEVLRFISSNLNFDNRMPSPERIWQHMQGYATQEMSFTGKGSFRSHQPMNLQSSKINRHFGHKDPMLLIEYAFRHRPMEQVLKLIETHDPNLEKISAFSENKKIRILSHLIPNHVSWENFNQYVLDTPSLEKELENHDSLQKFLFLHEKNLFPKFIDSDSADEIFIDCCIEGNAEVATLVFEMPEFPLSDSGLRAAFLESVRLGNIDIVKILLNEIPNFMLKNQEMNTLFHFASTLPSSEIMKILLMPEFLIKFSGNFPAEQWEVRRLLLNMANSNNASPMELAINEKNSETVKLLLEAGADVYRLNSKGNHFFQQAVFLGNGTVVKLFLESGLETGQNNSDLSALLRRAINKSEREIALMLIAHCAATKKISDLNTQYSSGSTPLLLSVKKKDINLIKALLIAGADPAAINNLGQNVLHKISIENYISEEKLISTKKNLTTGSLVQLINQQLDFSKTKEIVETLISVGAAVNVSDKSRNTPLIIAARKRNTPLVQLLLSQGADINAVNKKGYTALHYALENQDENLSKYLLANDIDFDSGNFNLDSALSLATASNDRLAIERIKAATEKRKLLNI